MNAPNKNNDACENRMCQISDCLDHGHAIPAETLAHLETCEECQAFRQMWSADFGAMAKVAVTFPGGTHDLWMRYWLASGGIHPDRDISLITIPPRGDGVANYEGNRAGYLSLIQADPTLGGTLEVVDTTKGTAFLLTLPAAAGSTPADPSATAPTE